MTTNHNYTIRTMRRDEIELAVEWAGLEGWNPGFEDAAPFFAADPRGFFIGELEGQPIGCISAVKYGLSFGFIGFYIVKPEFRGQGYGIQLWWHALAYLKGFNIGLDGVYAQQDNYKKSGFKLAYRNFRYQGLGAAGTPLREEIVPLAQIPFDQILAYDSAHFPAPRPEFLRLWLAQPNAITLGALRDGQVSGYGMLRPCRIGYKIGPLFAEDEQVAESLFLALGSHAADEPIFLDVPETNPAALRLVEKYKMNQVFATARMYTSDFPALPIEEIFGVTSFELG